MSQFDFVATHDVMHCLREILLLYWMLSNLVLLFGICDQDIFPSKAR